MEEDEQVGAGCVEVSVKVGSGKLRVESLKWKTES